MTAALMLAGWVQLVTFLAACAIGFLVVMTLGAIVALFIEYWRE